jgi:hypothetical protein
MKLFYLEHHTTPHRTLRMFKKDRTANITTPTNHFEDNENEHDISSLVETQSIQSTDSNLVSKLSTFYLKHDSADSLYQTSTPPPQLNTPHQITSPSQSPDVSCEICHGGREEHGNYIILACNHIFHVVCLAEEHFADVYKYPLLDEDFLESRKCTLCSKVLSNDDLLFLHSKFLNGTVGKITTHQNSIEQLEKQLRAVKQELKTCYEYKHKLEHQREKSKQVVATLMATL